MYIKIFIYFILGYVNITVEGFFIERFLNTCISKKIFLWKTIRSKSTIISANIGIKDFKNVAKISKDCKCKIKINKKSGLPFILNKYRKRKIFAISLGVLIITLVVISNFIWNIEITGIESDIEKSEITDIINNEGVKIGTYKRNLKLQSIVNKLRIQRSDIAWVGMKVKGTNLIVEVVKADKKPEIINEEEYCNIVAKEDGVITKIQAQNGTPAVAIGDTVKKGDILIKGIIEGKFTEPINVHSEGEVYAKTWHKNVQKVYYNQIIENQTGNNEKKYSINIKNFKINLSKTLSKFENYDTIRTVNKLRIAKDFYLPIEIVSTEYIEKQKNEISYTKEEAKQIGIQNAEKILSEEISSEVLNKYVNENEFDGYIEIEVIYEVLESIGTKEKF